MKKILGAVLAAGLLASAATADIGFSYKGSNYFTPSSGNLGYNHGLRKDCMSVTFTNAAGGVVVDFDVENSKLVEDEYYGWLNFGLPVGSLQVTAGRWSGRYANRIRADQGDLDGEDFELYKPGVINGKTGKDSDNLTLGNEGNIGVVAAWTLADKLPGVLIAKLGLMTNKDKNNRLWNSDKDDVSVNAGFTGEVAYRMDGLVNVNFAARSLTKNNWSFGLWASPLMVDKLQMTVGATVATVNKYNDTAKEWGANKTEWGVDLRARYKVTDALSITTMNNISSGTAEDGENELILWDMLNATYSIADNLTTALTIQSVCKGFDSDHEAKCNGFDVTVSPSLAIRATERAAVTTSLRAVFESVNFTKDWKDVIGGVKFTIPVIFTYSY